MLPSLIASPNYYDSSVACVLSNGVVAFAAKQHVIYLARPPGGGGGDDDEPLVYAGFLPAHQVKCTGVAAIDEGEAATSVPPLEEGELPPDGDEESPTTATAFLGGGRSAKFASCGQDGFVRVWDFAGRRCLREFGPTAIGLKEPRPACLAAASAAARPLAIGCESGHVVVLHWLGSAAGAAGLPCRPFGKDQSINQVLWKPDSATILACAGRNGQVCILSAAVSGTGGGGGGGGLTAVHRLAAHSGEVVNLAWSPGCSQLQPQADLATVGRDHQLKLWRLGDAESICIATVKVPLSLSKKRWVQSDERRYWSSLAWTQATSGLLFTTPMGDILRWAPGEESGYSVLGAARPLLSRLVFALVSRGDRLFTFGIDWWVCEYRLASQDTGPQQQQLSVVSSVPTASGFALCAQPSPTNPTTVAVGCGDGCIRVWRQGSPAAYDVGLHWQGINGRVTALAWHPHQEGLLAFGTDSGQVGCLDTLQAASTKSPPVRLSPSQHSGCVYIVRWGRPIGAAGAADAAHHHHQHPTVYSVGNFRILMHDQAMSQPAIDVTRQLPSGPPLHQQPQQHPDPKHRHRTDAQFKPDGAQLAVGNESGLVEIFDWPAPVLRARAQPCRSIVNALAWHPGYADECRNWLAIGTNSPVIFVLDTTAVSGAVTGGTKSADCVSIGEPMISLKGHRNRITALCWSPHTPHHLLSGSFDGTAQIWDVRTGDHLGNFAGHSGRIYTVLWSAGDPDVCLSGSEDHCLLRWRVSGLTRRSPPTSGKQYRPPLPHGVLARADGPPGAATSSADVESAAAATQSAAAAALNTSVEELDLDDLLRLVEQKKRELTAKASGQPETQRMRRPSATEKEPSATAAADEKQLQLLDSGPATLADVALRRGIAAESRKRPSLLPLSGRAENARAAAGAEDDRLADFAALLAHLAAADAADAPQLPDNLLALLPRPHAVRLVDRELRHLLRVGHLDNYLMLLVWSGRTQRAVQEATASGYLPDWLVAVSCLAAASAPDVDASVAAAKAEGLRRCGDAQLAATYLLSARRTADAVDCLLTAGKAREALVLCNLRLLPADPIRTRVLSAYAQTSREVGRLELCAQLLLLLGQPGAAVDALLMRRGCGGLGCLAAMQVWLYQGDLAAAMGVGLDWLSRGLLDTNEAGSWRRELRRLGDRRLHCLEALLDTFDRLQARVHVNWRQFAADLCASYGAPERAALLVQIEQARSGRQPALSASQKLLHLSLDVLEQLLRRCGDSPEAAAAALSPLLANHERQVRLMEPEAGGAGGGSGGGKPQGSSRVGDELVAALSHAALAVPAAAAVYSSGDCCQRQLPDPEETEDAEDEAEGANASGRCPAAPAVVPDNKENVIPA